jgi:hypothetical protein
VKGAERDEQDAALQCGGDAERGAVAEPALQFATRSRTDEQAHVNASFGAGEIIFPLLPVSVVVACTIAA